MKEKQHTYLESVDIYYNESTNLKITTDPLKLAKYVNENIKKKGNILDIGAGSGIIDLLISKNVFLDTIHAVEIQKEEYNNLVHNVDYNNLSRKIIPINENILNINTTYNYIVSNPPYMKVNSGKLPELVGKQIAKYEIKLTIEDLIRSIKNLLVNHGEFFIIIPDYRLNDVFTYIYDNKLKIKKLKYIEKKEKEFFVIIHGQKGGVTNSGINIEFEHINNI